MKRIVPMLFSLACVPAAFGQASQRMLYVTNNFGAPNSIAALRILANGSVALTANADGGPRPSNLALSTDGRFLLSLNWTDTPVTQEMRVLSVLPSGELADAGFGATVPAGSLSIVTTPQNFVIITSLTPPTVSSYRLTDTSLTLVDSKPAGEFPSNLAVSADGAFVYCVGVNPTSADLYSYTVSPTGVLTRLQSITLNGDGGGAGVALHPGGKALYVSAGLLNRIDWFTRNPTTGLLTFGGSYNTASPRPVELAAHPAGTFLYASCLGNDTVEVVRINPDRSLAATGFQTVIGDDVRDITTDGRTVFVADETAIGFNTSGLLSFAPTDAGSLTSVAPAVPTGGARPQYLALWAPSACPGDSNFNGVVNFDDLTEVLKMFGSTDPLGDSNIDGRVNFDDLTTVLANFGSDCSN